MGQPNNEVLEMDDIFRIDTWEFCGPHTEVLLSIKGFKRHGVSVFCSCGINLGGTSVETPESKQLEGNEDQENASD